MPMIVMLKAVMIKIKCENKQKSVNLYYYNALDFVTVSIITNHMSFWWASEQSCQLFEA